MAAAAPRNVKETGCEVDPLGGYNRRNDKRRAVGHRKSLAREKARRGMMTYWSWSRWPGWLRQAGALIFVFIFGISNCLASGWPKSEASAKSRFPDQISSVPIPDDTDAIQTEVARIKLHRLDFRGPCSIINQEQGKRMCACNPSRAFFNQPSA